MAGYDSLVIEPQEDSDSAEINAYYIFMMAYGEESQGAATGTPLPIAFPWEDAAAWNWLESRLDPDDYEDLARDVWSHGHAGDDAARFSRISKVRVSTRLRSDVVQAWDVMYSDDNGAPREVTNLRQLYRADYGRWPSEDYPPEWLEEWATADPIGDAPKRVRDELAKELGETTAD